MRYNVLETDEIYDSIEDVLDRCIRDDFYEDDSDFEDWVNNRYGEIRINGGIYTAFDILCNMDDSNYNDLNAEYCEELNQADRRKAEFDLKHADIGDTVYVQDYTVEVIGNENEQDDDEYEDDEDPHAIVVQELRDAIYEAVTGQKDTNDTDSDCIGSDLMKMFQVVGEPRE